MLGMRLLHRSAVVCPSWETVAISLVLTVINPFPLNKGLYVNGFAVP